VIFHSYVRHVSLPEGTYCVRLAAAFFGVGDSHRIVFPPQDDKPPRIRWVVFPDFSGYVPTIFDEDDPYIPFNPSFNPNTGCISYISAEPHIPIENPHELIGHKISHNFRCSASQETPKEVRFGSSCRGTSF